ncbi:MAG: AraC family transcriptional regulator [Chloroflexi bacterium AL-W]|nr:AraC family transcriptional regulator [Chloroflexi bacterium AL-N1]NOK68313.1 AraC family transcriptional regulator [Chloroflexi bacterium AL-N10]NOK73959.1 AraC family transcriptional regulator [Chloroflexi bacterium AL-N5]NOK82927.1 AraC family transcriptional regulator [Chloroflexi bacterium AL-W]NOK90449.1 AraC family transcriptional regulator [Chloroflexi bacterium AL-N15]
MAPYLESVAAVSLVGIGTRTTNDDEANSETARIPTVYQQFFSQRVGESIPKRSDPTSLYAVSTNYESNYQGACDFVLCQKGSTTILSEGLTGIADSTGQYMVFEASGEMPQTVVATWQTIWGYFDERISYRRLYTLDFEWYDQTQSNKVKIYIAVEPR